MMPLIYKSQLAFVISYRIILKDDGVPLLNNNVFMCTYCALIHLYNFLFCSIKCYNHTCVAVIVYYTYTIVKP